MTQALAAGRINIFAKLARGLDIFTIDASNEDLLYAKYTTLIRQLPLLYFILAVNAISISVVFARSTHMFLTILLPAGLCCVCILRGLYWHGRQHVKIDAANVLRQLKTIRAASVVLTLGFIAWGIAIFPFGDAYAQAQDCFFLAVTMLGCIFCLTNLKSAAVLVTVTSVIPFAWFFLGASKGRFSVEAINLALVVCASLRMVLLHNKDFADLIVSSKSLRRQQEELEKLNADHQRLAHTDSLTGLANRRELKQCLQDALETGSDSPPIALMFLDLDGFKDVNDSYGHEIGDKLLKLVSREFEAIASDWALLCRLGGDEFALLVTRHDAQSVARPLASTLLESLQHPIQIGDRTIQVGASVGVAFSEPGLTSADELLRRADVAMYHVKANGKANIEVYTRDLDAERERRQDIEDDIKDGIVRDEFEVVYQPIVDAQNHEVVAVEALLRWPRRPDGIIGPADFVPVAESSGLINTLGAFVLRRACEDMLDKPGIKLSVNVSPAQFRDPNFEGRVAAVLRETGFPPQRLELEITEGYLIGRPARARAVIEALLAMGIRIALDDFGTGYTSIAYLQQYRFSRIKIDKSLVDRIELDQKAGVLISGIVFLANGLDMKVTAEGVENEAQASLLRLAGCSALQGFYFAQPCTAGEIAGPAAAVA